MLTIPLSVLAWSLFIVTLILFVIIIFQRIKIQKDEDRYVQLASKDNFFERRKSLLRQDELELFNLLRSIITNDYYIFPQVHLSEMIDIKNSSKDHANLYEILGNKSVDFGVFSKDKMKPLLAIELNGVSHLLSGRKNRDALVRNILNKVGIQYIPIQKGNYKFEEIIIEIKNKLQLSDKA